jgi:Protein of unknown function (DUF3237)
MLQVSTRWRCAKIPVMELRPFGTLTIHTDPDGLFMLGKTSAGQRIIQEFLSVSFEGERLKGTMTGKAGADWITLDSDGNATIDIRLLLSTDDGARVFVTLVGMADWAERMGAGPIYSMARLESGDERYRWVNNLPLVSKGAITEGRAVAHEFFQLV